MKVSFRMMAQYILTHLHGKRAREHSQIRMGVRI